jgi:hypothetical protein
MIKKVMFLFFGICLGVFFWNGSASAQTTPICQSENGIVIDDYPYNLVETNRQGACQTSADYYEFFFKTLLVCEGFPILGTFSNCQDMKITPTSVIITDESSSNLDGVLPLPGTYTYSVSMVSPEIKVAGAVEFSRPQLAGAAPGNSGPNNWSSGRYCQQKPGNFIFSQVVAETYNADTGNTYCRNTPFTQSEISPSTITLDDFLLVGSQYRATNHETFDPSKDFNAVALDANNQISTRGEDVKSLFLVQKLTEPVVVEPQHNTIEFTFSLERGLANNRACNLNNQGDPENIPTCLLTWFWMGGSNMRLTTY